MFVDPRLDVSFQLGRSSRQIPFAIPADYRFRFYRLSTKRALNGISWLTGKKACGEINQHSPEDHVQKRDDYDQE